MMPTLEIIKHELAAAPYISVRGTLVRLVPFVALAKQQSVDWLFTSGKPNRYNPVGVECLYFAEDAATARAEYEDYWTGLTGGRQPVVTYYAEVQLQCVLDLSSTKTVKALGITERELFLPWRGAKRPTATQLIGQAVTESAVVSAIRYPSRAARRAGFAGANVVIFRERLQPPDLVRILGATKKALQQWP